MPELPSSWLGWSRRGRIVAALSALILLGMLVVAARLEPHPDGVGTHQQLGLGPCTFRLAMKVPCPACGMTTSWAHVVRGEWLRAWHSNAGGTVLALLSAAAIPLLLASAIRGRWLAFPVTQWWFLLISFLVLTITMIHWLIRILPHVWR